MSLDKNEYFHENQNGKRFLGLVFIVGGVLLIMKKLGNPIPDWIFTWPLILIVIGFYIGFKSKFQNHSWWVVSAIGGAFLFDHFNPDMSIGNFIWPAAVIAIGLMLLFGRKRNRWKQQRWEMHKKMMMEHQTRNSEDYLDSVSVFGGIQKNIITKNFKGGEVVCVFSGAEINLLQSDFDGEITLELVNVMGGTNLIIPQDWVIVPDVMTIFGGIEDRRMQPLQDQERTKKVKLTGVCVFGGIEIKSY